MVYGRVEEAMCVQQCIRVYTVHCAPVTPHIGQAIFFKWPLTGGGGGSVGDGLRMRRIRWRARAHTHTHTYIIYLSGRGALRKRFIFPNCFLRVYPVRRNAHHMPLFPREQCIRRARSRFLLRRPPAGDVSGRHRRRILLSTICRPFPTGLDPDLDTRTRTIYIYIYIYRTRVVSNTYLLRGRTRLDRFLLLPAGV